MKRISTNNGWSTGNKRECRRNKRHCLWKIVICSFLCSSRFLSEASHLRHLARELNDRSTWYQVYQDWVKFLLHKSCERRGKSFISCTSSLKSIKSNSVLEMNALEVDEFSRISYKLMSTSLGGLTYFCDEVGVRERYALTCCTSWTTPSRCARTPSWTGASTTIRARRWTNSWKHAMETLSKEWNIKNMCVSPLLTCRACCTSILWCASTSVRTTAGASI